jgi:hypothetical protein
MNPFLMHPAVTQARALAEARAAYADLRRPALAPAHAARPRRAPVRAALRVLSGLTRRRRTA